MLALKINIITFKTMLDRRPNLLLYFSIFFTI